VGLAFEKLKLTKIWHDHDDRATVKLEIIARWLSYLAITIAAGFAFNDSALDPSLRSLWNALNDFWDSTVIVVTILAWPDPQS